MADTAPFGAPAAAVPPVDPAAPVEARAVEPPPPVVQARPTAFEPDDVTDVPEAPAREARLDAGETAGPDAGPPSTVPGFLQPYAYPSNARPGEQPVMSAPGPLRPMRASSPAPDFDVHDDARSELQDKLIGEILRATHRLSGEQIESVLARQAQHQQKFGEAAIALGFVERDDVMWALSQQFQYAYAPEEGSLSEELVVAREPFSDAAELFREMRTQLLMSTLEGGGRRAMAVVSAGVGEGKSFFAANLAVAFSQLGARTLLIDADMRTPRLHRMFGIEGHNGLSAILAGRAQASVVRPISTLPSLYLLPAGAAPPNPSELVQRPSFAAMMKGALRNFEYIVVDTPAAWHGADARVIASRCGAALAIGRRHHTPVGKLQQLVEQITKNTERFAGVVMNDF